MNINMKNIKKKWLANANMNMSVNSNISDNMDKYKQ